MRQCKFRPSRFVHDPFSHRCCPSCIPSYLRPLGSQPYRNIVFHRMRLVVGFSNLSLSVSRIMCNLIKTQWEKECCPHGSFSSARASLPSFVYPIHCLQPFPPPCCQPCRNLGFHLQRFDLIDVGLVGTKGGEGGEQTRPDVDLFSCVQNVCCSMCLSLS